MYNQFYFLHLDRVTAKTAGVRLFDPLYKVIEDNGVASLELNKNHKSHNHWKDFDSQTFILCVVREPIYKAISDFSWWANYGDNGVRTHQKGRDNECPKYTKEDLIYWLENVHVKNCQSKAIGQNVPRINMLIKAENIQGNENKFREAVLNSLGISHVFEYYPPDFEQVFMPIDSVLNTILNDNPEIKETIRSYNQEDIELYAQASTIA